jgi:AbrB family looped-hinge helix DNA binding protein
MEKEARHKFYGVVTVGERGQIAIPREARTALDIRPHEKLVIVGMGPAGALMILKAAEMEEFLSRQIKNVTTIRDAIKKSER